MDKDMNAEFTEHEKITVIAVEPGKKPYVQSISNTLEALQHEVGGDIQAITPYADPVAIIAAEEGKLMGLPFNRAVCDEDGKICDYLVGKFLIVGRGRKISPQFPTKSSRSTSVNFKRRSSLFKSARNTVSSR